MLLAALWPAPVPDGPGAPLAAGAETGAAVAGDRAPDRHGRPGAGATSGRGGLIAVDGDTLRLPDGRRVRLPSLDAPELGRPLADRARDRLAGLVADGAWTLVPADPARDRYGRLLADVHVDDRSVSAVLVAEGLAWVYLRNDGDLLSLQQAAVEGRRGVHGAVPEALATPLRVARARFHHPACRLVGRDPTRWPLARNPGGLFKQGLSPCRRCLPWPPAAADR